MRIFIERQGRKGEKKLARVRGRFGGDSQGRDRESFLQRRAVLERDERRIFSRLDDEDITLVCDATMPGSAYRESYCHLTGVVIPPNGGKVRLDADGGSRRPTLYFGPKGKLLAAHF